MRNYLLGTLVQDSRAAIEESILRDAQVYEELLIIEEELIDQYLTNNLSPSERDQFETHFLITAERQKNLRFGRLLKRYLTSQAVAVPAKNFSAAVSQRENSAPAKTFLPFAGSTAARRALLAASAAVVAGFAVLLVVCWFATRRHEQRVVQQDSALVVPVTLLPGTLRSGDAVTQRVPLPPKGVSVKLELQVSNLSYQKYKSELLRESKSVQSANELKVEQKGEQHIVPWTITGEVLSPGDYQVKLSGVLDSGHDEFIDNYSFRVGK